MGCIGTYYNPVKNMMTNSTEQLIDRVWSKGTSRLRKIVEDSGNHVMYYLSDGPERAFVSEQLMLIPEDTELPPDYIMFSIVFLNTALFIPVGQILSDDLVDNECDYLGFAT